MRCTRGSSERAMTSQAVHTVIRYGNDVSRIANQLIVLSANGSAIAPQTMGTAMARSRSRQAILERLSHQPKNTKKATANPSIRETNRVEADNSSVWFA